MKPITKISTKEEYRAAYDRINALGQQAEHNAAMGPYDGKAEYEEISRIETAILEYERANGLCCKACGTPFVIGISCPACEESILESEDFE